MAKYFTVQNLLKLYGSDLSRISIIQAEKSKQIPSPNRTKTGTINRRVWDISQLPEIGEKYGFLWKPDDAQCITIFTTKGGVLKTSLALNIARLSALHNIQTCVVGLDLQGDISSALNFNSDIEDSEDMQSAIKRLKKVIGLSDIYNKQASIDDAIQDTDIPTLKLIPETPGLALLDRSLNNSNRREYWLNDNIIKPLKKKFDLVILDCSPNWNLLIGNALVACDVLISPLECKINQYNNLEIFQDLLVRFKKDLKLNFRHIYVPTRFMSNRKLSSEIRTWYLQNVENVTLSVIRESSQGDEAVASKLSVPEFAPITSFADEMRELMREVWNKSFPKSKTLKSKSSKTKKPIKKTKYNEIYA